MYVLPAGLPAGQHARFAFTKWSKNGFLARGVTGAEIWEYSPHTVNIWNFAHKFAHQWRFVCTVLTKFLAFYVFNLVAFWDKQPSYERFPLVGAFSHNVFNNP